MHAILDKYLNVTIYLAQRMSNIRWRTKWNAFIVFMCAANKQPYQNAIRFWLTFLGIRKCFLFQSAEQLFYLLHIILLFTLFDYAKMFLFVLLFSKQSVHFALIQKCFWMLHGWMVSRNISFKYAIFVSFHLGSFAIWSAALWKAIGSNKALIAIDLFTGWLNIRLENMSKEINFVFLENRYRLAVDSKPRIFNE